MFAKVRSYAPMLARFAVVLVALILSPGHAAASDPSFQDPLSGAVLCKGDPLGTVRAIAGSKTSTFKQGIATSTFGEAMMEKNILILRTPIVVAGARTSSIILSLDSPSYSNFNAFVYGIFEGDYKSVVKKLGLSAVPANSEGAIAMYQRPVDAMWNGQRCLCPKTIGLTPLAQKGKFLLGCGWCNGGRGC
jgi:hypothetical protein